MLDENVENNLLLERRADRIIRRVVLVMMVVGLNPFSRDLSWRGRKITARLQTLSPKE